MTARRFKARQVSIQTDGDVNASAVMEFYEPGTAAVSGRTVTAGTLFQGALYAGATGGSPINPAVTADATGQIEVWTATQSDYDLVVKPTTGDYRLFARESFEIAPQDVVLTSGTQAVEKTFVGRQTFQNTDATASVSPAVVVQNDMTGVTSVVVTAVGSGYTSAPTVSFTGGGGSGAAATATINGSGQLSGFTLTSPGTGYTASPTVVLTGGGGTGGAGYASMAYWSQQTRSAGSNHFRTGRSTTGQGYTFLQQSELAVNLTGSDTLSQVMAVFDFTTRVAGGDTGTITVFAGEGKISGRDGASFTPTGRAAALRGIEVRGVWGTWAGIIPGGDGGSKHGIGIGIETNTARNDGGTAQYSNEQGALLIQATDNVGQFLDPPAATSPNYGIAIGGATNASSTQCAFEWPVIVLGNAINAGIFTLYRDGTVGLAKIGDPADGGRLQVKQVSGNAAGSGIRLFYNGAASTYLDLYQANTNRDLTLVNQADGIGTGSLVLAASPSRPTLHVTSTVAQATDVARFTVTGVGVVFAVTETGAVEIAGTQVLTTQQTGIAAITPSNFTAVPGSFADLAAVRTYLLTLVSELETRDDTQDARINSIRTIQNTHGLTTTV